MYKLWYFVNTMCDNVKAFIEEKRFVDLRFIKETFLTCGSV